MATLWGVSVAVVFIVLILAVVLACMAAARPSIKKGGGEIGIPRSARDWNMYLAGAGIRNYMWSPRSPADNAPDPPPGVVITPLKAILPPEDRKRFEDEDNTYLLGAVVYSNKKVQFPACKDGDTFATRLGRLLGYLYPADDEAPEADSLWTSWWIVPRSKKHKQKLLWSEGIPKRFEGSRISARLDQLAAAVAKMSPDHSVSLSFGQMKRKRPTRDP